MIYLDNNATTSVTEDVLRSMIPVLVGDYANPSSLHHFGTAARARVEEARKYLATSIGAHPEELIFTASGSEGNSLCTIGFATANRSLGNHIITTAIEHPSVKNACAHLRSLGFDVTYLPVDEQGFVSCESLASAITPRTILISIGHANNEIGTVQPIANLTRVAPGIAFHTDAVQSYLKEPFDVAALGVSIATFSGHKFHAPKGCGFVYRRTNTETTPMVFGGQQERGARGGTENVASIVALSAASRQFPVGAVAHMRALQSRFVDELSRLPSVRLNGPRDLERRLCSNINFSCDGIEGEAILQRLSDRDICVSTGSACSSRSQRVSPVLQAIKCPQRFIHGNIRVGLSWMTTESDMTVFMNALREILAQRPSSGA